MTVTQKQWAAVDTVARRLLADAWQQRPGSGGGPGGDDQYGLVEDEVIGSLPPRVGQKVMDRMDAVADSIRPSREQYDAALAHLAEDGA